MQGLIDKFDGEFHFLSNFYRCSVIYEGIEYKSSEHAYMAAKTDDPIQKDIIRSAPSPAQAKRLGRQADLRSDWEDVKLEVMENVLRAKFSDPRLAEMLALTNGFELVEGNTWGDVFWGECRGIGENHLGKLLMKIRAELVEDSDLGGSVEDYFGDSLTFL